MVIILFHGIVPGNKIELAWKETWTSSPTNGEESIFWPERWLPNDIGNNVQILSLSYNDVHDDVTEIGRNLLESLVANARYNNVHHNFKALRFKSNLIWNICIHKKLKMTYIYFIMCHVFGTFLEIFDVSFHLSTIHVWFTKVHLFFLAHI